MEEEKKEYKDHYEESMNGSDDSSDSEEEERMFKKGNSLLKGTAESVDTSAFSDLNMLRNDTEEAGKRFSIMAEVFTEDEEKQMERGDHEHAPTGDPNDVQFKRMSIRVQVKPKSPYRKCTFVRESGTLSSKFYPHYHLYLDDDKDRLLIAARKLTRNRNASYYLFDMSMQTDVNKCTRDSPNLIGKLVKKNFECTELVLARDNDEFAGIVFFRPAGNDDLFGGSHPRNITAIIPKLDEIGNTAPHDTSVHKSLTQIILDKDKNEDYIELRSKDPIFYNGCYRLHFLGKAAVVPSVKNFQV
jgi:Tub family